MAEQVTLGKRFEVVSQFLKTACPHWQLGSSYEGWVQALHREHQRLVPAVIGKLREHMCAMDAHQAVGRWKVLGIDGSDGACPRTEANQAVSSDKGQPDGTPLLSFTVMYHLRLRLPWAFRVGPSTESERLHLSQMIDEIPADYLTTADAGFIGYDCCRNFIDKKRHFLLRVGGNVNLLTTLGYHYEIAGETVYLWPIEQQDREQPPLQLRLIVIRDPGKQPIYLVTSVLDKDLLTDEEAREIYLNRWGLEVFFRATKQTLEHDRVYSRTPSNCQQEMTWAVIGMWLLKLLATQELVNAGLEPKQVSVAKTRDLVRAAIREGTPPKKRATFQQALLECKVDSYRRTKSKSSRNYPRKKQHKTPKPPKIKLATEQQRQIAQSLTPLTVPI